FPHTAALLVRSCCQFIESGSQHFDEAAVQLRHGSFDKGTMRPGFIVLLFALSFPAHAQEGYLGSGHDKWHQSFYRMLQRPDGKGSCCNLTDCRPTSGRTVDGHYEVKVNGAWVSVPQTKIIRQAAPDGGYHVCAPYNFKGQPEELYCVILAPEGCAMGSRSPNRRANDSCELRPTDFDRRGSSSSTGAHQMHNTSAQKFARRMRRNPLSSQQA